MKVGDLVRIKKGAFLKSDFDDKLAIVVYKGTWSVDIRVVQNGWHTRIDKKHLEVISESR